MPVELDLRAHSSHRCVFWNKRDRAVPGTLGISVTAQAVLAPGDRVRLPDSGGERPQTDSPLEAYLKLNSRSVFWPVCTDREQQDQSSVFPRWPLSLGARVLT